MSADDFLRGLAAGRNACAADVARARATERERHGNSSALEAIEARLWALWDRSPQQIVEAHRAEIAAAERRGAEAMREAAANECERPQGSWGGYANSNPQDCADAVRRLPLPGDAP